MPQKMETKSRFAKTKNIFGWSKLPIWNFGFWLAPRKLKKFPRFYEPVPQTSLPQALSLTVGLPCLTSVCCCTHFKSQLTAWDLTPCNTCCSHACIWSLSPDYFVLACMGVTKVELGNRLWEKRTVFLFSAAQQQQHPHPTWGAENLAACL